MTRTVFDLEGVAAGSAYTTSNTTPAINTIVGTVVADTAMAWRGYVGAKLTTALNTAALVRLNAAAASATMSLGIELVMPAATPANNLLIATVRYSAGICLRFTYTTANNITLTDSAAGSSVTIRTGETPGAKRWLSVGANVGTTSTNGSYAINWYDGAGVLLNGPFTSSAYNLGAPTATGITGGDFGVIDTTHAAGIIVGCDYAVYDDTISTGVPPDLGRVQMFRRGQAVNRSNTY